MRMSLVRKGLNLRKKLLWEALAAFLRTLPQMNCILKLYFKNMQSTLMAAWSILKPTPSLLCTVPPGHAQVTIIFKGKFRVSLSHQDRSDRTGASAFSSWWRQLGWSGSISCDRSLYSSFAPSPSLALILNQTGLVRAAPFSIRSVMRAVLRADRTYDVIELGTP